MSLTPDGVRYFAASRQRVARPFHYRWLLPRLCGESLTNWRAVTYISMGTIVVAGWWYGGTGWRGLFVASAAVGCSGVWKFNRKHPVLVDLPAMAVGLLAAAAWIHGLWWLAVLLVIVAGSIKETTPVFCALWAWSPVLLVGLVAPALRACFRAGDDVLDAENAWILRHPFQASRKYHAGFPLAVWVLPWGALLAGMAACTPQLWTTLAASYGQTLIATDTVRLYQWGWPVLAVAASRVVPLPWLLPLALLHVANPFAGEGI